MAYVGRFAPSPTGELHLGTLTAAVASFLHARQNHGEWLIRIEDIDPPREVAGSTDSILRSLEALALLPDREILYQSERTDAYRAAATKLKSGNLAYYCRCSRKDLRKVSPSGRYPGTCRDFRYPSDDAALRFLTRGTVTRFTDHLHGPFEIDMESEIGDFIIYRRDGLPAYHLAVVIDDADQGVTDVVRGADLLPSTAHHVTLQQALGLPTPAYWHIPLVTDESGEKLSKRFGATAVDPDDPVATAAAALDQLGLPVPDALKSAPVVELWQWATSNFHIKRLTDARQKNVL